MTIRHTTHALRRSAPALAGLWLGAMMIASGQAQALTPVEVAGTRNGPMSPTVPRSISRSRYARPD